MQVKIDVVCGRLGSKEVEMSGVTTIHYAAKRVAEEFGLDGEMYWGFLKNGTELLKNTDLISEHCDGSLELAILRDRESDGS